MTTEEAIFIWIALYFYLSGFLSFLWGFSFKKEKAKSNFLKEHNIKHEFPIITLDSLGIYFKKGRIKIINWLEVILANFSLIKFLFKKRREIDIIYFRDQHLFLAVLFGKHFF